MSEQMKNEIAKIGPSRAEINWAKQELLKYPLRLKETDAQKEWSRRHIQDQIDEKLEDFAKSDLQWKKYYYRTTNIDKLRRRLERDLVIPSEEEEEELARYSINQLALTPPLLVHLASAQNRDFDLLTTKNIPSVVRHVLKLGYRGVVLTYILRMPVTPGNYSSFLSDQKVDNIRMVVDYRRDSNFSDSADLEVYPQEITARSKHRKAIRLTIQTASNIFNQLDIEGKIPDLPIPSNYQNLQ